MMANPERIGFIENAAKWSKRIDVVTGAVGVIAGSAPLVAISLVSYLAGNETEKFFKKRRQGNGG